MNGNVGTGGSNSGTLPTFFTVAELADRWRCSTRHVHRIIVSGELPVHRFGKNIRIAAKDVLLYEARCAGVLSCRKET